MGLSESIIQSACKTVGYNRVEVVRLNEDATLPTRANSGDAGWDLYASEDITVSANARSLIGTSISLAIPIKYVGLIWPRSGLAVKNGVDVFAGVIDSSYRGEVKVCLYNSSDTPLNITKGDRIAQILIQEVPFFRLEEVIELNETSRGEGGFGSSGK